MIADIFLTVFGENFNCNACFQFIFIVCQIKKKNFLQKVDIAKKYNKINKPKKKTKCIQLNENTVCPFSVVSNSPS